MTIGIYIPTKRFPHCIKLPEYATSGASGMDLFAAISEPIILGCTQRIKIPTGIAMELPEGYEGQVRGRSGKAIKNGLSLSGGIGTIDQDYRGEIHVLLINLGAESYVIKPGEAIAQLVICPILKVCCLEVPELGSTVRGDKGFGSTDE